MGNQLTGLPVAEDIRVKIRGFIVENFLFGTDSPDLRDETSFLQSGVMDSTGILELIRFVEVTYQIQVADTETVPENLDSLNNIAGFVVRKVAEACKKAS
jgi:acyl carrier protein